MESAPSLEIVMRALQVLYHGEHHNGKEKASLWLGELQKSTFAWQLSDQLLMLNHDVESCYFAAQTMRTKIQYSFQELPSDSHESLKTSLLSHCTKITSDTPQVIVTQLCLALADLSLQMLTWENPVLDLISRFESTEVNWIFLLEVLSLIPEEVGCLSVRLGRERSKEVVEKLKMTSPLLIQFLSKVVREKESSERHIRQVVLCLSRCMKISSIPFFLIISNNILQLPFSILQNQNSLIPLHKAASDCICSGLFSLETTKEMSSEEGEKFSCLLFEGVCSLSPAFIRCSHDNDAERLRNYSRIFTDACEAFIDYFVSSPNKGFGNFHLLDLVLSCADCNNFEVANITFTFWNRLSEHLYDSAHLKEPLKPHVKQLMELLRRLMKIDLTFETLQDCPDDFLNFRYESHELVSDLAFVVDPEAIFEEMFHVLKQSGDSWPECETCIFVMSAVAKQLSKSELDVINKVLELMLGAGDMHQCMRHSCIKLIGELRLWIDRHPHYIDPCLRFLLVSLQSNHLVSAASESIESLCLCSPGRMASLLDHLPSILQSLDGSNVSNEAIIGILKGCAGILGRMPAAAVSEKMKQLCTLLLMPLNSILDGCINAVVGCKDRDPVVWIDRLAAIFSHLNLVIENGDIHPCQITVEEVWPVLTKVFLRQARDGRIIERCCRCIRFAVRCLGHRAVFLIGPIINEMVILYQTFPHSCCLYLGSILVDEFGGDADHCPILISMFDAFLPPTMKLLDEASGPRNYPDVVDDLFRLSFRFVQKAPEAFVSSCSIQRLLVCATHSCCLDHKDANESLCLFLIELIKTPNKMKDSQCGTLITALLREQGQDIVNHIIKASLFCLPNFMAHKTSELLYELILFDRNAVSMWLDQTLKALPLHTTTGKQTITDQQLTEFHHSIIHADDLRRVSKTTHQLTKCFR